MRPLLPLLSLLLLCFGATSLAAQCPAGELKIESDQDIADFVANFPNCTEVESLAIYGSSNTTYAPAVTDLSGLSQLTAVTNGVEIGPINATLAGLGNIATIGGNLNIHGAFFPNGDLALQNPKITDFNDLNPSLAIGGDFISRQNFGLTTLGTFNPTIGGDVRLDRNPELAALGSFNPSGIVDLFVSSNPNLDNCAVSGFCGATGTITIRGNGTGSCENLCQFQVACPGLCPTAADCAGITIVLENQVQLDNFAANNATCTELEVALNLVERQGNGLISNTGVLNFITEYRAPVLIGSLLAELGLFTNATFIDELIVRNTPGGPNGLNNLNQLSNVATINSLTLDNNNNLSDVSGFGSNVPGGVTIGDLTIIENDRLTDCAVAGFCPATGTVTIMNNGDVSGVGTCENETTFETGCFMCPADATDVRTLSTQEEVDAFVRGITADGCAADFLGGLTINSPAGTTLDLTGLNTLTDIGGELTLIGVEATEVASLSGLTSTGGLTVTMSSLVNLGSFNSLANIDGPLTLTDNPALTDVTAIETVMGITELTITGNTSLPACTIPAACDATSTTIENNDPNGTCTQEDLTASCYECPTMASEITTLTSQAEVDAFVAGITAGGCDDVFPGGLTIESPTGTTLDLSGLNGLTEIGGPLVLTGVETSEVAGLSDITMTGGLTVEGSSLTDLSGFSGITNIDGPLVITGNPDLTDVTGITGATGVTDLTITNNPNLDNCNIPSACTATGSTLVAGNGDGNCENTTSFQGACDICEEGAGVFRTLITQNDVDQFVADLATAGCPESYGGGITVLDFGGLLDLSGLSGLTEVGGPLALIGVSQTGIDGLVGLTSVGGLTIQGSSITNLDNFGAPLEMINGPLTITGNQTLTDISGISGATGVTDVTITGNPQLDDCAIDAACDASGTTTVNTNGDGNCNQADLEAACNFDCTADATLTSQQDVDNFITNLRANGCEETFPGGLTIESPTGEELDLTELFDPAAPNTGLTSIGGVLTLTDVSDDEIAPLGGLTSVGGLTVQGPNSTVTNLGDPNAPDGPTGLSGLTSIAGPLVIDDNPDITDITGISGAGGVTSTTITNNPSLVDCAVAAACDDPAATISGNGTGGTCEDAAAFQAACTQLPVELTSFTGSYNGKSVTLNWATASEVGSEGFTVQRSDSGNEWKDLGFINSANEAAAYDFSDDTPLAGINLYRLEQRDWDGTTTLSDVVTVTTNGRTELTLFPNPAQQILNVRFDSKEAVTVRVLNLSGQLQFSAEMTGNRSSLDVSDLKQGIYLISVNDGERNVTSRFVKR